jgi:hypothetical protein
LPAQAAQEPRCRGARKLQLTGMTTKAVDGIANLAQEADSESVQLRAWRGVLADLMSVSKFSVLEYRMTEIEEELDKREQGDTVTR